MVGDDEKRDAAAEEVGDRRGEPGSQGGRIFKSPANRNGVVVLFEWDAEEEPREFVETIILAKRGERAHIYSYETHFLEHVEDLDARVAASIRLTKRFEPDPSGAAVQATWHVSPVDSGSWQAGNADERPTQ